MSDSEGSETKKCPYCGRMTSAKANFCYWCARELAARPERPDSTPVKQGGISWLWVAVGAVILVVILLMLFWR
jgi:hypothetical protein